MLLTSFKDVFTQGLVSASQQPYCLSLLYDGLAVLRREAEARGSL